MLAGRTVIEGGGRLSAPAAWPASAVVLGPGVTETGLADVGGHVEPDERKAGYRWFQPRVDSAAVPGYPDADIGGGTMIVMLPHPL